VVQSAPGPISQKEKIVEQEISITGEPTISPETCLFRVDRPVYPGGAAFFANREAAGLSPLARRIFEIAEVESVLIAGERVTVTKSGIDPWPVIGRQIGAKIREHLRSNDPAVSEEYERRMPSEAEIRTRVEALLEKEVNPALGAHGGYVELVEVRKNSLYLKLGGGCQGCASAGMTMKLGVEKAIRAVIPEVGEVLDTTDHAAGRNPYSAS
jgi:Fe-S cluster biogenesis protein NfuA